MYIYGLTRSPDADSVYLRNSFTPPLFYFRTCAAVLMTT